jgi:hypothetical protein
MSKVAKIVTGIVLIVGGVATFNPWAVQNGLSLFLIAVGASLTVQGTTEFFIKRPGGNRSSGTNLEAGKVNVRIAEPTRWLNAGLIRQGGGVLFAEFDAVGNLWYIIVHSDCIAQSIVKYYLDDEEVTLDESGYVITDAFCLNEKKESYSGIGTKVPYVQIFTTTYTETNPTPPAIAELSAACPQWTADHKLVGTTYSVIKILALGIEDRYKIYKWRGALGMGEPVVSILAQWSHVYDPRDATQTLGVPSTYKFSRNPVLIWAWFRTHPYGRNKSVNSINWDRVAEQANICDQSITGIEGTTLRYRCDFSTPDDKDRASAEQDILLAMDAQLVFDNDGKTWVRAGSYSASTVSYSRNRDIVAMESVEGRNIDNEYQGVIVRYIEPDAKYSMQPSAPWRDPKTFVAGRTATYATIDVPTCSDHNQAMRLAKALGMRSQPEHRIAPTIGLRGLKARQERIVGINYDNTFAGEYEIVSPVEVDETGQVCSLVCVPIDANRWSLLPGEELPKPVVSGAADPTAPALPTSVDVDYNNARLEATFDPAPRSDVTYEFQYIATVDIASDQWFNMVTSMVTNFAYSSAVDQSVQYQVRWRTVTTSGRITPWSSPYLVIDPIPPTEGALQSAVLSSWIVEVTAGSDVVTISTTGSLAITDHTRRYPDGHADVAVIGDVISTGLTTGDVRSIAYDDESRSGGTVTYNLYTDDNDAHASATYPGRHYVGYFVVPSTGTSGGGGGGIPGGYCVAVDTPILMANNDRNGPGLSRVAADLKVGQWLWTQHEKTMAFGAFQIDAISFVEEAVYTAEGYPRATAGHLFWIAGEWVRMDAIGAPDGHAMVAKITVRDAHTYVSAGVLSHNVKPIE